MLVYHVGAPPVPVVVFLQSASRSLLSLGCIEEQVMKQSDLRRFKDLPPKRRALQALLFGAELHKARPKKMAKGQLPHALKTDALGVAGPVLEKLHGVARPVTKTAPTLHGILKKKATKKASDVVLSPRERKAHAIAALRKTKGETIHDVALRQLAVGMFDRDPLARACAAYAYWQATQADHVVVPILRKVLKESKTLEEFEVAAHCLAKINPKLVKRYMGPARYDKPVKMKRRVKALTATIPASMTVIIHGTFAAPQDDDTRPRWYAPGGDFHQYVKQHLYADVYSGADYFFWSGRYAATETGLRNIWREAAKKLLQWCQAHPAQMYRFLAHSHGANVVNMATAIGLQACTLIHLSPPVRPDLLPVMANISSRRFFTIRPRIDLVVTIDGGWQDYKNTSVKTFETRKICSLIGHDDSHDPTIWQQKAMPQLIQGVC